MSTYSRPKLSNTRARLMMLPRHPDVAHALLTAMPCMSASKRYACATNGNSAVSTNACPSVTTEKSYQDPSGFQVLPVRTRDGEPRIWRLREHLAKRPVRINPGQRSQGCVGGRNQANADDIHAGGKQPGRHREKLTFAELGQSLWIILCVEVWLEKDPYRVSRMITIYLSL